MARKRTTRREKHAGHYYFDKKTKQHIWTISYEGERHRVKDRDEEAAKVRFAELKDRLFRGVDVRGAKTLFKEYLPRYIDTEVAGRTKDSNVVDKHHRADLYILPTFGEMAIEDIKRRHIVAWVDWMMNTPNEKGRYWSRNSIKQALGLLRRALQAAVPEFLEYNPAADVVMPERRRGEEYNIDAAPKEQKVFTAEQMALVLAEIKRTNAQHGFYVYYVLMIEYGWRRGEGLGVRRKDIDFENRTITIAQQVTRNQRTNEIKITTPKTESSKRLLPADDDEILQLIREQLIKVGAGRPDDLLFPNKQGKRRQPNGVTQHFRRVCARLGFVGYNLHSLRKYAITDWRTSGVDLEVAAAMAGHKGVKVTAETYSQATMDRKRTAMRKRKGS